MNENDNALTKPISPLKAIRAKCLDCSCNQINEIKLCSVTNCALYPFRFGNNPFRKHREYTEEEKKTMAARLNSGRKLKNTPNLQGNF